jgi:KaiC/GvpD/RAD55 family RecA-like ATPase
MSRQVTIQVSEQVLRQAAQVAAQTRRGVEDVLAAWLESVTTERPVEELSGDEVLALAELRLTDEQDVSLSELLERNRESTLDADGHRELDEMMRLYEHGLLRKSQALKVAVRRGLREPLQA